MEKNAFKELHQLSSLRVIMAVIVFIVCLLNIFIFQIKEINYIILGINLVWIVESTFSIAISNYYAKQDMKNLTKLGFREDFDFKNRFDLKTKVGEYEVSTVDLGIDHSFGIGEPLYYKTMIFKKDNYSGEFDYQERYSTEEQAKKGHEKAIAFVKKQIKKEKK